MFRYLRIRGDGTEIYIKSKNMSLNIEELKNLVNHDYEFVHQKENQNYCFIKFNSVAKAAEMLDILKQREDFLVRVAYVNRKE